MIICIVGWYGTETMGDRAILDGILSVINEIDKNANVRIGSLFPFYTERTLLEERLTYGRTAPSVELEVFNIRDKKSCKKNIYDSNIVIMGGGPLMDLEELFIIRNCFRYAQKKSIPAVIMGCGLGPLKAKDYIKCIRDIFGHSSAISFRDHVSLNSAKRLYGDNVKYICIGDPAIISVESYEQKNKNMRVKDSFISVNLREPTKEYGKKNYTDNDIRQFILDLSEKYGEIRLIPMHTFSVGGDDRKYYSILFNGVRNNSIHIIHEPLSLDDLYHTYKVSEFCVGMRYHSVVIQTILNGNNYIINYTDPLNGKTIGFLKEQDNMDFYNERIVNLQSSNVKCNLTKLLESISLEKKYNYKESNMKKDYVKWISNVLKTDK